VPRSPPIVGDVRLKRIGPARLADLTLRLGEALCS
jgi:hypothetical protein